MPHGYYRRRRKSSSSGAFILIGLLVVAWAYSSLSAETMNQIIILAVAAIVLALAAVTLIRYKMTQRQKQKMRALELVDAEYMDGLAFEKYVAELLKSPRL